MNPQIKRLIQKTLDKIELKYKFDPGIQKGAFILAFSGKEGPFDLYIHQLNPNALTFVIPNIGFLDETAKSSPEVLAQFLKINFRSIMFKIGADPQDGEIRITVDLPVASLKANPDAIGYCLQSVQAGKHFFTKDLLPLLLKRDPLEAPVDVRGDVKTAI